MKHSKAFYFLACIAVASLTSAGRSDYRDRFHQPEKVMEAAGVRTGMVIGEVGAGRGYFTFKLSERVGQGGKIYANDIDESAMRVVRERCDRNGIGNIETIVGEVEDPLFPESVLDMVFIVNAFHDLAKPVALLNNLIPSLKPGGSVVILDRDPAKYRDTYGHFLSKEEVMDRIEASDFELDRVETFLPQHNIYIIRPKR